MIWGPLKSLLVAALLVPAAHAEEPSIQVDSSVEANYAWTFPSPPGEVEPSLGFLSQTRQLRLTDATISLNSDWGRVGFHLEGGDGDFYKLAMAEDSWKGPNQYISQAYVFGRPFGSLPIRIEAGKFFTSVGAELAQSDRDFNTSRSLISWYGSPLYHVGIRSSAPITERFTIGAQLLSGCNTTGGAHGHQSMAYTAAWAGKHWSWSQLYMGGNEKLVGRGWRQLSDTVFTLNPSSRVTGYVEMLAAVEKRVAWGYDSWYGWATAWKASPREKWSFSPRLEWYNDRTGATTGLAQHIAECTFTGEYRARKWVMARLEYRSDWSDRPFYPYESGHQFARRKQAMIAGIMLLLHRGWPLKPIDSAATPRT